MCFGAVDVVKRSSCQKMLKLWRWRLLHKSCLDVFWESLDGNTGAGENAAWGWREYDKDAYKDNVEHVTRCIFTLCTYIYIYTYRLCVYVHIHIFIDTYTYMLASSRIDWCERWNDSWNFCWQSPSYKLHVYVYTTCLYLSISIYIHITHTGCIIAS